MHTIQIQKNRILYEDELEKKTHWRMLSAQLIGTKLMAEEKPSL